MKRIIAPLGLILVWCTIFSLEQTWAQREPTGSIEQVRVDLAQCKLNRSSLERRIEVLEGQLAVSKDAKALLRRAEAAEKTLQTARAELEATSRRESALVAENALLRAEVARLQSEATRPPAAPVPPSPPVTNATVESTIKSDFTGQVFDHGNIFELQNGQIWKQTEYHIHYHYAYFPRVIIYRDRVIWKMKVEGIEHALTVERIR